MLCDVAANINITVGFNWTFHLSAHRASNTCEERVNSCHWKCNPRRSENSSGSEALKVSPSLLSVLEPASSQQGHSWEGCCEVPSPK